MSSLLDGDVQYLLTHEADTLRAAAELLRASISVLEYLRTCEQLPGLASQPLDDVINSARGAFECTDLASRGLFSVAHELSTLVHLRHTKLGR